jgi:hypothetical protein
MNPLRRHMIQEMQIRNLTANTLPTVPPTAPDVVPA